MNATIFSYDTATDTFDPARDIVSHDLSTIGEILDWVAKTAQVNRDNLRLHGSEIWVGGACAPLGSVSAPPLTPEQIERVLGGYADAVERPRTKSDWRAFAERCRGVSAPRWNTSWADLLDVRISLAADDAAPDPLQGYSADEIIVGPGGQTLAEATATASDIEPGWEDRAVERARREGVLPPR